MAPQGARLTDTVRRAAAFGIAGGLALACTLMMGAPRAAAAGASSPPVVGHVSVVHGNAIAQLPGQPPRQLACGDPIHIGDRVSTAAGSSVSFLADQVYVQLTADTTAAIERTAAGGPRVELQEGRVRIVDTRGQGAAAGAVSAVGAAAAIQGNDAEAYVLKEKIGRYSMFCDWQAPLVVSHGKQHLTAKPGQCVIAKKTEPLYAAQAQKQRIALLGGAECLAGPVVGAAASRFSPTQVAAGPPVFAPPLPAAAAFPPRSPCDNPGSGCAGNVQAPPPVTRTFKQQIAPSTPPFPPPPLP